ncbi:hypothetical protein FOXYSP1_01326 [Fusarium oxysporum f. sp. phaseoli]
MNNLATSLSIQVLQSSTASLNDYQALSRAKLSAFDLFEFRYQYLNFKLKRKHKPAPGHPRPPHLDLAPKRRLIIISIASFARAISIFPLSLFSTITIIFSVGCA